MPAAAAALSLATAAVAAGMRAPVEDGTLSVRDGRATIVLKLRGGVIGRVGRGKLTVTDSNPDSVGLGLWIVRQLARAHGGDAGYEEAGPGARIVVTLPMASNGASTRTPMSSAAPS